ncbi:Asp-tRNA(Asn)/Glu-tRNA(Gln) amidotransferase subunit GatA [Candidatus Sumerlaeota bacterium]|nr:Asp-tRNA(Asn)/Glu-tRNA(Gln) amidotransferase subunit GatA [Candidatus Sumerlaeota bacterium]
MEAYELTVTQALERLQRGELSCEEWTRACLDRARAVDGRVRAFVQLDEDGALASAREADAARKAGAQAPLLGAPIAIKDNMHIKGRKTTCSSKMLENFTAPFDATVVAKLRDAGAVFLGKTNLDEFAMGSSTENSAFFTTRNPWNLDYVPGGSSGGSAASVAAYETPFALGSDTGGSIRQPAAFCGIYGLKPTYGRVSRYGLVAFGSSLDQIGPLARNVEDIALLLNVISGKDPRDSTSSDIPAPDFTQALGRGVKGLRLGIPKEYFVEGVDPEVKSAVHQAIDRLCAQGAEAVEVSLPHTEYAISVYYICCTAEASSNLARYDGAQYGHSAAGSENIVELFTRTRSEAFGKEVKRRIMLGTYVLSAGFYDAYYLKALKVRTLLQRDFERAFEQCDVIVTPPVPTPAFRAGERIDDPLQMYLGDIFTISVNLAGVPALCCPAGFNAAGLPLSVQLIAPIFSEERLIQTASVHQELWRDKNIRALQI